MHNYLNTLALVGATAALTLSPAMALAQEQTPAETAAKPAAPAMEASPADARLASLPAEKQAALKAWPQATQDYYWALPAKRQELFWLLSDADKVRLSELPEDQQGPAWAQIESLPRPAQG
jgi:hypothetical protein